MKNFFLLLFLSTSLNGCLMFNTISYEIKLNEDDSGIATVLVKDIRSNAGSDTELEEDKNLLFDFLLKSDDLISQQKEEDKDIISRELNIEDGSLNGKGIFNFSDIQNVEKILHEGGFYYLTLELGDSVISTNGTLIYSRDYKRILWHDDIKTLEFTMLGDSFEDDKYKSLAEFYEQ